MPRVQPALVRYGYAVVVVVVALAAALALRSFDLEGFLFVIAVPVAVWLGGRGPGVLAVLLSAVVLHFVFIAPNDTGSLLSTSAYFVVFSVLAIVVTLLSEARHRAERSILRARDELESKVRERTAELARQAELRSRAEAELARVSRVTTLGEVTASIAHEVNQPLAAIMNNANAGLALLPDGHPGMTEVRAALSDILADAERASAIIERVRALARRSPSEMAPLRLEDVLHDVVALTAGESAARRVTIRTEVSADLPVVSGDRVQLQQVLLNIVVNGMDAMEGVDEPRRLLEIRGRERMHDGHLEATISVRDGGIGIDGAQLERLFDAFYTTKPHGMGMGLAISRSIIEMHGGRLWAAPNDGPGATFTFSVPAGEARARG